MPTGAKKRKERLKRVAEDFAEVAVGRATKDALSATADAELFAVDTTGATAASRGANAAKAREPLFDGETGPELKPLTAKQVAKIRNAAARIRAAAPAKPTVPATPIVHRNIATPHLTDVWGSTATSTANTNAASATIPKEPSKLRALRAAKPNKANAKAVALPLPGTSYNPAAGDHVEALQALAAFRAKTNPLTRKPKAVPTPVSGRDESSSEEEEEDEDEEKDKARSSPRVKKELTAEDIKRIKKRRKREQLEKIRKSEERRVRLEKERELEADRAKSIAKQVEKELAAERELTEARRAHREALATSEEALVPMQGARKRARVVSTMPEVVPPVQLPQTMREIPGMGGTLASHYQHMRARNLVDAASGRGKKPAKAKLKVRDVSKFDFDKYAEGKMGTPLPAPRFAKPKWQV